MSQYPTKQQIFDWLTHKHLEGKNGIIFDCAQFSSFDLIQDFIETYDHPFQTPIIYYQAFPEESAIQFLNTLGAELISKLGISESTQSTSLAEIVRRAELKTIIIDRCHLHPLDTLTNLLEVFASFQVSVILVGAKSKIEVAQILKLEAVADWDRLIIKPECKQDKGLCRSC